MAEPTTPIPTPQDQPIPDGQPVQQTDPNEVFNQIRQTAKTGYDKMIADKVDPKIAQREADKYVRIQSQLKGLTSPQREQQLKIEDQHPEEGAVTEFVKSTWNGFGPPVLKMLPDVVSMASNAADLHSDKIDQLTDEWDNFIDKHAAAYINPEHNLGIFKTDEDGSIGFTNLRSLSNGVGNGIGMIGQFAAAAFLTGGTGDVAEAATAVKMAQATGDVAGLAQATQALKSAQTGLTLTKAVSGSLLFAPQIYKDGKDAGLNHEDAARLAIGLSIPLGLLGTFSGAEQKALEKYIAGDVISEIDGSVVNKLSDNGILKGLEGYAKGKTLDPEEFKTAMKASLNSAAMVSKRFINANVAKTAGKEFTQMYLQSAVQTFGEQMYDATYAQDKEIGKGRFGAKEFVDANDPDGIGPSLFGYKVGKKAALADATSGIYGAIIGSAMGAFSTPLVNQSIYGYLDAKIREGKAEEGVGKVKKMADVLLEKGKITPEQHEVLMGKPEQPASEQGEAVPAQKGLIDKMYETAQGLKGVNSENLSPTASYDAYNYQFNERPKYDAKVQQFEDVKNALAQTLSDPVNQNPATADIAKIASLQKMVAEGYNGYRNGMESVVEINKHVANIAATGKMSEIGKKLSDINSQKHDWSADEQLKPLMEGYDAKPHAEVIKEQGADKNGVRNKDLVGESVIHTPTGRKGTIANEMDGTHVFQPHADEADQSTVSLGSAEDVVDRGQIDHNLTSPKPEQNAVQEQSAAGLDVQKQAGTSETVSEGQPEEPKATEARQEEKVNGFVERKASGDKMDSHEDLQFYENNKEAIENRLAEKVAEQPEESGDNFLEELKAAQIEKPIEETPEQKAEVTKEIAAQVEEVQQEAPAQADALEEIADHIVEKSKPKKKSGSKKIGKKQRSELIFSEPNTPKEMAMQHILGLSELEEGDTKLNIDEATKELTDLWNGDHSKQITEAEMRKALLESENIHPDDIAKELMTSFADEKGKVLRTIAEREKAKLEAEKQDVASVKEKIDKLKDEKYCK